MRKHVIPSTLLALLAAAAAGHAQAQVKPVEPFGGRPFGAPPDDGTAQPPQGTTMGAPGMSSVQPAGTPNPGTPPAVIVAPVPVPAPPPAPVPAPPPAQVPPPAAAPAMQAPQPAPAAAAPVPAAPAPAPTATPAPAPSSLAPPFTGGSANRNAPPAVAAAPAPAPAAAGPQQPVRGLPPDAPKLVISGSVYSPDRAKRVLIVNGQVAHEGADLGQGVVLEEVRHEGAVLGYKGSRYTVVF